MTSGRWQRRQLRVRLQGQGQKGPGKAYKAKRVHRQRSQSMRQHADAERPQVHRADHQIPQEIADRQRDDQPVGARVAPHPLLPAHLPAGPVLPQRPGRHGADDDRLDQRHDMDVPADARARREGVVDVRDEAPRDVRRADQLDEGVERKDHDDLVYVERQRRHGERGGKGLGEGPERCWWRRDRVGEHLELCVGDSRARECRSLSL